METVTLYITYTDNKLNEVKTKGTTGFVLWNAMVELLNGAENISNCSPKSVNLFADHSKKISLLNTPVALETDNSKIEFMFEPDSSGGVKQCLGFQQKFFARLDVSHLNPSNTTYGNDLFVALYTGDGSEICSGTFNGLVDTLSTLGVDDVILLEWKFIFGNQREV